MSAKIIIKLRTIEGAVFASSLDVAHDFDKEHKHVLRDIERIREKLSPNLGSVWFRRDTYHDPTQRRLPCYDLARNGFMVLVARYDHPDAVNLLAAYFLKFDEMEGKLGAGARTEALFDRSKRDNVVAFPPSPQGELFEAELPVIDPVREEGELEAELQKYNLEFELPKALVPTDEKQRHLILEGWRLRHHNLPPNQLQWKGYWNDTPQVCYGPGGVLVECWDFDDDKL